MGRGESACDWLVFQVLQSPSSWRHLRRHPDFGLQGLGTSDDKDAKDYFSNMPTHMIPFAKLRTDDRVLIEMAFSKKKVEDRKEWLRNFTVRPYTAFNHNLLLT
jgi:hypothetical protein